MTLRQQFLLPCAIVLVLGLGFLTYVAYVNTNDAVRISVAGQLQRSAEGLANSGAGWFADRRMDLTGWAADPLYSKAVQSSFVGRAARRVANERLAAIKDGYGYYVTIGLVDTEGTVVASSDQFEVGRDQTKSEFFASGRLGKSFVSDALKGEADGAVVVTIAAPVSDADEVTGVLYAVIDLSYFDERFVAPVKIGKTGRVLVFNEAGRAIIHPDKSQVMRLDIASLVQQRVEYAGGAALTEYDDANSHRMAAVQTVQDIGWTVVVDAEQAEIEAPGAKVGYTNLSLSLAILAALSIAITILLDRIIRPLRRSTEAMRLLAGGDTTIDVPALDRSDEIGEMARAIGVFKDNAIRMREMQADKEESERRTQEEKRKMMRQLSDDFEGQVKGVVEALSSSATEMQATAEQMSGTAERANRRATGVASASEQATANVQTVAAATEELSSSITEIGRQVNQSAKIASKAVSEAEATNTTVQSLSDAAQKIGEVVTLINNIASQTNLLALNATIEAARAGEAGKGFAVVAQEVKNLANQTAKATDEIAGQITAIQEQTSGAVGAIDRIQEIISEISDISTTIASAVEEQGVSTQEIARNVQQAAKGTQQVNGNIGDVSKAVSEAGSAADQVLRSAGSLSEQSSLLQDQVERFLNQIRAT